MQIVTSFPKQDYSKGWEEISAIEDANWQRH